MGLLDFIFPPRCVACGQFGTYLCLKDRKNIRPASAFCPVCLKKAIGGSTHTKCKKTWSPDGLVCLFHYATPTKEMIHELKYRFVRDIQEAFVKEIKKSQKLEEVDFKGFTLVPVPLSVKRKRWRGFNQTEVLGEKIARQLKIGFDQGVLNKIKETKPQVKLHRAQRVKQVSHVFRAKKDEIAHRNFLVFDDVWTTGATIKSASTALKRRGAGKVWGLALATPR
jgi:ComF family protein